MSENEIVVSVEELINRNVHEQSPAVTQTTACNEAESIDFPEIDDLEVFWEVHNQESQGTKRTLQENASTAAKPKIQKVPTLLRDLKNFEKYYEPRVVCIGPIHHRKQNLNSAEQYKTKFLWGFIERSGRDIKALYKTIKDNISGLKELFDHDVIEVYSEEDLSRMLFLDGCFILMFIVSYVHLDFKRFDITNVEAAYIQQDLFLLENQIPLLVLNLLTESSSLEFKEELKLSISVFILTNIMAPRKFTEVFNQDELKPDSTATHLLEVLHMSATGLFRGTSNSSPHKQSAQDHNNDDHSTLVVQPSFRGVQKLQAAGIHLKPTGRHFLSDVDFHSQVFTASLALPPLLVDDSTRSKFSNLIAYEMCPDNRRTNYEVTSYICFMNSLIEHKDDVKELRLSNILFGNDEKVASLFAEIATGLVPNPEIYKDVKKGIENHYHRRLRVWMAEAFNKWPIVAFFAALFSLILSVIQTWYATPFAKSAHK